MTWTLQREAPTGTEKVPDGGPPPAAGSPERRAREAGFQERMSTGTAGKGLSRQRLPVFQKEQECVSGQSLHFSRVSMECA